MSATEEKLLAKLDRLADALERRDSTPPPELVGADGVGALLGVGSRTVRRLDDSGQLPQPVRVGGSIRWRLSELRQWIDAGCPPRQRWEALRTS
jgi:predicted DNA-binding transcriptional regulator AlpA